MIFPNSLHTCYHRCERPLVPAFGGTICTAMKKERRNYMAIETGFDIPAIEISTFELTLVGDSPLIVHAWSEKAKKRFWTSR